MCIFSLGFASVVPYGSSEWFDFMQTESAFVAKVESGSSTWLVSRSPGLAD